MLHRRVLTDYATRLGVYRAERDQMEARFLAEAVNYQNESAAERAAFTARCFEEADQATDRWAEQVAAMPPQVKLPRRYRQVWEKATKASGYNFGFRSDYASTPGG